MTRSRIACLRVLGNGTSPNAFAPALRAALASAAMTANRGHLIMRKLCMAIAAICSLATTAPLPAAERTEFQISPRAGRGVLKLDQFRHVDEDLEELDTGGLGVSFAILTPIGLLLEGG